MNNVVVVNGPFAPAQVELTPMAIAAGRRLSDRLFGGVEGAKADYTNVPVRCNALRWIMFFPCERDVNFDRPYLS